MTRQKFEELEKKVYSPDKEWYDLFSSFNEKNKTNLNPNFRSGYVVILKAIAAKHGWEYKGSEYQRFSPLKKVFE